HRRGRARGQGRPAPLAADGRRGRAGDRGRHRAPLRRRDRETARDVGLGIDQLQTKENGMKSNFLRGTLGSTLGAVALSLVLPLSALAQKEVVVWHGYRGGEKAAFEKVVDEFNRANAGKVKVTTLAVPYDAFADKI